MRRKLKKSTNISSTELEINSKKPWYIQLLIAVAIFLVGYTLAFYQFNKKNEEVDELKMANQSLDVQIIKLERQLQIERVAQEKLQTQINEAQESLLKTKEDLVFYERMLKRKKRK